MLAVSVLLAGIAIPAQAQTYTPLYDFTGSPQWFANPQGPLALGQDGNFYGITMGGALPSFFVLTPEGTATDLWNASNLGWQCTQGFNVGPDGLLYGACWEVNWSKDNAGAIVKFDPNHPENGGTILYEFPYGGGCSVQPNALTLNVDGNFYGTTQGANCGSTSLGEFFKLTPSGKFTLLHTFQGSTNDAAYPNAVTLGSDGNFYGTSLHGGAYNSGTIFKITPKGKVTLLYTFNGNTGPYEPAAALTQGADGKWYGTTFLGGTYGWGIIFQLAGKKINVLHNFNYTVDNAGYPNFPLTLGTDGAFYSPSQDTAFGGYGPESIFKITTAKKPVYTDLFDWLLLQQNCNAQLANGCFPGSPLTLHPNGMFYGVTENGGGADSGVFYSFGVGFSPYIIPQFPLGKKNTTIGIFGVGLTGTTAVSFNGVAATFNVVSDTYLTATIPTTASTGYVTVTTPSGTLKSAVKLKVK
jgi:uncharacterized repeat protein (TIGR03803 family)